MTKDKILDEFRKLKRVFDDPEIKEEFSFYKKTIQFSFPDIEVDAFLQIGHSAIDALGVGLVQAELRIEMDSEVFFQIMERSLEPEDAYSSGKIQTKGNVGDLLKLRKLLI